MMPARNEQELEKMKRPTSKKPTSGDDCDCWTMLSNVGSSDNDDDRKDGKKDMTNL